MTTPAATLFVAAIDPATGLPARSGEMTPFADPANARIRARTLTNLSARAGRDTRFGVWRIVCEYQAEVTLAPAPKLNPSTQQVQP